MDTERTIVKIESEAEGTRQFDDLYIEMSDGTTYRVQVKNYPETTLKDITITSNIVSIKNNQNVYNPSDNNILLINTEQIDTDTSFMGFPAITKSNITIIPLTEEDIANKLDEMYQSDTRELQIIQKAYEFTCSARFTILLEDIPPLITFSTNLLQKTVLLRPIPDTFNKGITHLVGKPGVGKSHYVEEIKTKFNDAIIYKFWIGPHDENLINRLQFYNFLDQLGMLVFKSPRSFTQEELVCKVVEENLFLIIDGIDHVENYNPKDMDKYICFLKKLDSHGARVLLLSRPIRTQVEWATIDLINWNIDETRMYLALAYGLTDYSLQKKIYDIADGYPIVTHYLAEHIIKHGTLPLESAIANLYEYYDALLCDVPLKSLLCLFATNNSFFTYKELAVFTAEPESYDILLEFISSYPYLFQIVQNRISLVHDSLNTYLRNILPSYPNRLERVNSIVQNSLLSGNVEYIARFSSFHFDEAFVDKLLVLYSSFPALKKLLDSTLDFNSISSFYSQLQYALEYREGVLNIYQYYSFALIFQIVTRNDLVGYDGLMYQILSYLNKHEDIEDHIFSSGIMWHLYLACQQHEDLTQRYIAASIYGTSQLHSLYEAINDEYHFYDCIKTPFVCENIAGELLSDSYGPLEKSDLLIRYLVSIWIHGKSNDIFYDEFCHCIKTESELPLVNRLKEYSLENYWIQRAISCARNRLHELGYFGEDNKYRVGSLMSLITCCAPEGSFFVAPEVLSYIRLANHEQRVIDITSVNYVWSMYAQRKDYSVQTIDVALLLFENEGFLDEADSIEIINRLMRQSEKGIRLLLTSYINAKGPSCVKRLIEANKFRDRSLGVDIFDLSASNINCFPKEYIDRRLVDLLSQCRYSRTVEASDIHSILESNYSEDLLDILQRYNIAVLGCLEEPLNIRLEAYGIKLMHNSVTPKTPYVPFANGYIHEEDFGYIQEHGVSIEECTKYADGWYSCLPYIDIFNLFDSRMLKENHLHLLHRSMFARVVGKEYIGNWNTLIGNIPSFAKVCKLELNWHALFDSFVDFLDISLIYHPLV